MGKFSFGIYKKTKRKKNQCRCLYKTRRSSVLTDVVSIPNISCSEMREIGSWIFRVYI